MTTRKVRKKTTSKTIKSGSEILEEMLGELTFARLIKSHRKAWDYSQKELADKLGITKASLCDLEKGRRIPSPKRAWNIASVLGMCEPVWVQIALQDQLREQEIDLKISVV